MATPFSLVCTIAALGQDKHGIEGAMDFAEAGVPVGFMAMPNIGSTSPATMGGALVVGNAEVVSAMVLRQRHFRRAGFPFVISLSHGSAQRGVYRQYSGEVPVQCSGSSAGT